MIPTIAAAGAALRQGQLTATALVEDCLGRIAAHDAQIHAHILVCADAARAAAAAADAELRAGRWRGPLHGIPIGLKDIVETAGLATTGGSRWRLDHVPAADAPAWARLRAAGAILIGKHNTHEFALGGPAFDLPFPPARNPWSLDRFTGGSSSGSGAAVAAGFCLGALGTDTSGSIRGPAAFCGVAGLKPTFGRVSVEGVFALSPTQDHVGPLAWTAQDCALLFDALAGATTAGGLAAPLAGVRIGVARAWHEREMVLAGQTAAALDAAVRTLADAGAILVDMELPPLADFHAAAIPIALREAFDIYGDDLRRDPGRFSALFRQRVLLGAFVSDADYAGALRLRRRLGAEMEAAFTRCDALVTAMMPWAAPPLGAVDPYYFMDRASTVPPPNVTGQPAMSVCTGFDVAGLPLAMQLIAARGAEGRLLAVAHAYEGLTPWRERRPELP